MIDSHDETQAKINTMVEASKEEFKKLRANFSGADVLFTMDKNTISYMAEYEAIRQDCIANGYDMPPLDDKISVTFH